MIDHDRMIQLTERALPRRRRMSMSHQSKALRHGTAGERSKARQNYRSHKGQIKRQRKVRGRKSHARAMGRYNKQFSGRETVADMIERFRETLARVRKLL